MSSIYREFKCRICGEKKTNPSNDDVSVCQDCNPDYKTAYNILMEYFGSIADEEKDDVDKRLKEVVC